MECKQKTTIALITVRTNVLPTFLKISMNAGRKR